MCTILVANNKRADRTVRMYRLNCVSIIVISNNQAFLWRDCIQCHEDV